MQLRTKWEFGSEQNHRAILSVDIDVPTYPPECPCSLCTMRRTVSSLGMTIISPVSTEGEHEEDPERRLSERDQQLIDDLLGIHGVISVQTGDYRVGIERGPVFDWAEITPKVEHIIAHWAGLEAPTHRQPGWPHRLLHTLTRRKLQQ